MYVCAIYFRSFFLSNIYILSEFGTTFSIRRNLYAKHIYLIHLLFFEFLFVYLIFLNIVCSFHSILFSVFFLFFLLNISFALPLYIAVCLSIDFKNKSSKWLLRKCAMIIFAIKRSQTNTRKTIIDECMYFGVTMWWVLSSVKKPKSRFSFIFNQIKYTL